MDICESKLKIDARTLLCEYTKKGPFRPKSTEGPRGREGEGRGGGEGEGDGGGGGV